MTMSFLMAASFLHCYTSTPFVQLLIARRLQVTATAAVITSLLLAMVINACRTRYE
jgi:hypothetical protein